MKAPNTRPGGESGAPAAGVVGSRTSQLGEHTEERVANPRPIAAQDRGLERELALHLEAAPASLDDTDEVLRVQLGDRRERDQCLAFTGLDLLDAHGAGRDADAYDVQQLIVPGPPRAESIGELGAKIGHICVPCRARDA